MTPPYDLTLHRGSRSSVAGMYVTLLYFEDCTLGQLLTVLADA
jgi:hypothetical protein